MGLVLKKETLPGYKTLKKIYDLIPGGGAVKKIVVAATIGVVIVGAIVAGGIGIAALVSLIGGSIIGPALTSAGILVGLGLLFKGLSAAIPVLYNFNFNISDKEIDNQLKTSLESLYSLLGEAAGTAVGWLVCGILPATVTFAFNPAVAKLVMEDMAEEAKDEVWGAIAACQQGAIALLGKALMLKGYKSARRWLKRPDSPFYGFLKKHFGDAFTKWGDDGQPSFSMSQYVDDRVEEIEDPNWRNFTEEFVDSLLDSCSEALDNLSNSMRTHMAAYAMMKKQEAAQSSQMVVQLDFSRDDEAENQQQNQ